MRTANGFSMIELVVTIVIVAIVTVVAIPFFSDTQVKASWYLEQVKSAVRYAQRQAVAQRRPVYVDVQAGLVRLCYAAPPGCSPALTKITDGQAYELPAPSGVSMTPQSFSFNGLGQPSGAVSIGISGQTITVAAETGYVQ